MKVDAPSHFDRKDLRLTVDNPEDLILCKAVYNNFFEMAPKIPLDKIIEFLDMNPELIEITKPLTEVGYESMYIWKDDEKK
jgi:spore coat polysaccharide biosynthesis protein SpsF